MQENDYLIRQNMACPDGSDFLFFQPILNLPMLPQLRLVSERPPLDAAKPGPRIAMAVVGASLITVLVVAGFLQADPRGLGTHEQLGMTPCGFQLMFGIPCPTCGMTTSWSLLAQGQMSLACQTHFGGVLLAVASFVMGIWLIGSAICKRWIVGWPSNPVWALSLALIGVAIFISWIFKLVAQG